MLGVREHVERLSKRDAEARHGIQVGGQCGRVARRVDDSPGLLVETCSKDGPNSSARWINHCEGGGWRGGRRRHPLNRISCDEARRIHVIGELCGSARCRGDGGRGDLNTGDCAAGPGEMECEAADPAVEVEDVGAGWKASNEVGCGGVERLGDHRVGLEEATRREVERTVAEPERKSICAGQEGLLSTFGHCLMFGEEVGRGNGEVREPAL